MSAGRLSSLIDRIDPSLATQLAATSLRPSDRDLEELSSTCPCLEDITTLGELAATVGPLWRSLLDSDLEYRSRSAFAVGTSLVVRTLESGRPEIAESLRCSRLHLEPSLGNALYRLGVVQYEEGRERRPTIAQSAACFRSAVRTFERALMYERSLSDATRMRLLGKLGVAAAFLAREDAVSLAELLVAHRRFERSIELGNDDDAALGYLAEIRLRLFQRTGNRSLLEGMRRRLAAKTDKSGEVRLREAEILLHSIGLEMDLGRLARASRWHELTEALLAELRTAVDGVDRESIDVHDVVVLSAFRHIIPELERAVASRDPDSVHLASGTFTFPYGGNRGITDLHCAFGDEPAARVLLGVASDLGAATIAGDHDMGEFALKYYRLLERHAPLVGNRPEVRTAMERLAERVLDQPSSDRGQAVACGVLFSAWRRGGRRDVALRLLRYLLRRAEDDQISVWPVLRLADLARHALIRSKAEGETSMASHLRNGDTRSILAEAVRRAHVDPSTERRILGGRSEVFVAVQEWAFLEDRFVFKTTDRGAAERERRRLACVAEWSAATGHANTFRVPSVVEVLDNPSGDKTLVLQRAAGGTLDEPRLGSENSLRATTGFLALLHVGLLAEGDLRGRNDYSSDLRRQLKRCPFLLAEPEAALLANVVRQEMDHLPTLPKRDAHPGNWIVSDDGAITAVDLSTRGGRPLFYELIQLLDDAAHLPVTATLLADRAEWATWYVRMLQHYAEQLGQPLPSIPGHVTTADVAPALLCRAAFLLCYSEQPHLPRELRTRLAGHGTAVLRQLAEGSGGAIAREAAALVGRLDRDDTERTRLSRRMSAVLRHHQEVGMDDRGWLGIDALVQAYEDRHGARLSPDEFVRIARHHADTRFELDGHRIRARYGHSTGVDLGYLPEEPPRFLFHGTCAASVDGIRDLGIQPMSRDFVHLVETFEAAERIGRRHGPPAVLRVDTTSAAQAGITFVPAVAGIWLAPAVPPRALEILDAHVRSTTALDNNGFAAES